MAKMMRYQDFRWINTDHIEEVFIGEDDLFRFVTQDGTEYEVHEKFTDNIRDFVLGISSG